MVYVFNINENTEIDIDRYRTLLSDERFEKMSRYKFLSDRRLCYFSFILLRLAIFNELQITEMPQILCNGKPLVTNINIHFNITHCDNLVACVIDDYEVGIDAQNYVDTVFNVKSNYLTYQENLKYTSKTNNCNIRALTRIWTLKEAYGKFYGNGLCYNLCETDFSNIKDSGEWQIYQSLKVYSKEYSDFALSVFAKKELQIVYVEKKDIDSFSELILNLKN